MTARTLGLLLPLLLACSESRDEPAAPTPAPPGCDDATAFALPDGGCIRPGVAADGCAPGFEHDGAYGCEPILPGEPCPPGSMALPGETACRPVMQCGEGRWGDIPVDGTTQYVDGSYAGGQSNGSEAAPWTTVSEAVVAAAAGAIVAVAAGSYQENVVVTGKAVRIWGVCPERVAIVAGPPGAACAGVSAALCILSGAHGSEVRGVALSGQGLGVALTGSRDVLLEMIRVHDNARRGINVQSTLGPTSVTLRGSLVEQNQDLGMYLSDAHAQVEGSVVRQTQPVVGTLTGGVGLFAQRVCTPTSTDDACTATSDARVDISGSVLEGNSDIGLFLSGADGSVDASVVRMTSPRASDGTSGTGVNVQQPCVETSVGHVCDKAVRPSFTLSRSVIEQNHSTGLYVSGSDATLEASVVRTTLPRPSDGYNGRGISVEGRCDETQEGLICDVASRANLAMNGSLVDQNHAYGVFVSGADVSVNSSIVRDTMPQPSDGRSGRGINIQFPCYGVSPTAASCVPAAYSTASIVGSAVLRSHEIGIAVLASEATIDTSLIRATAPAAIDDLLGDGVVSFSLDAPATTTLRRSLVDQSARAGVASFGAGVALEATHIQCAAFELATQPFDGSEAVLEDLGGNLCGCPTAVDACTAVSTELAPPPAPGQP